jgi:short-subunit dehydrogenase
MSNPAQTIIITGAGRGIGRVIATYFAAHTSFQLYLISRTAEHLDQTARMCTHEGCPAVFTQCVDITNSEQINQLPLPESFSAVRALINNAGQFKVDAPDTLEEDLIHHQFDHNALSAALVTRRFLPVLREQPQALIANISSVASHIGMKNAVAYTMSKHALLGYTRSLREYLRGTNIAVTALSPGSTWSTSWEGSKADPETTIDSLDIAILLEALTRMSHRSVVDEIHLNPSK